MLIVPPIETLIQFDNTVSLLFEKYYNYSKQNQELASLRDWLLPMLMNGQVKIGDKIMEKV